MSANFSTFFVSGSSFGPTDLSLLKGLAKNVSFEDFPSFQEIGAYCGLDDCSAMTVINFRGR